MTEEEKSGPKNMYGYVKEAWKRPKDGEMGERHWERMVEFRRGPSFVRVEHPTRLDRARALGYRAKQGYVVVRARVRKGSFRKHAIRKGRRVAVIGGGNTTMDAIWFAIILMAV